MRWWKRLKRYFATPRPRVEKQLDRLPINSFVQNRLVHLICRSVQARILDDQHKLLQLGREAFTLYMQYTLTGVYLDWVNALVDEPVQSELWNAERWYAFLTIPEKVAYLTWLWYLRIDDYNIHELVVCAQYDNVDYYIEHLRDNHERYSNQIAINLFSKLRAYRILNLLRVDPNATDGHFSSSHSSSHSSPRRDSTGDITEETGTTPTMRRDIVSID